MAKSTKSKGKNARPGGKSGGSGGRTTPSAKTAARQRPAITAKEAAAKAVTKPAAKGDGAKAGPAGAKAAASPVASAEAARTKASGPRPRPAPTRRTTPSASSRYTPPTPRAEKVSPIWVPIVMFTCLGVGMLTIILNYVNVLPGPDPSNAYLMAGLALITVGFVTATKYH